MIFLVVLWPFMDLVDTAKRVGVNWLGDPTVGYSTRTAF